MGAFTWDWEIQKYVDRVIRIWALRLAEQRRLSDVHREEAVDQMWTDLIRRSERFNPARSGQRTFIGLVVRNKFLELLDYWESAAGLARRGEISLSQPAVDEDGDHVCFGDLIADRPARRRRFGDPRSPEKAREEARDLRLDVAARLATVSEELRILAERLMSDSISGVADEMGIPRTTLQSSVGKLREALAPLGDGRRKSRQFRKRAST